MIFKFGDLIINSEVEPWCSEGVRIGFYSAPGTRKSYTVAACIVEPFLEQNGTVVIFQPRSEWHTLKEKWGSVVVAGGPFQDVAIATNQAKVYADAIVHNGVSMIFDFSDIEEKELVRFAAELLARIFTLENIVRRPLLLVIEEAADYVPFSTKGKLVEPWVYDRMKGRIVKIATKGRPLGFMIVIISQRPAQLDFTVRMMCNISFYGKFHPKDLNDIKNILSAYNVKPKEMAETCVNMPHGSWIAITSEGARHLHIEAKRITSHGADTPRLEYVAPRTEATKKTVNELVQTIQNALEQELLEESEVEKLKKKISELENEKKQREQEISELNIALRVKGSQPPEKIVEKTGLEPESVKEFVKTLREELIETFDKETEHFLGKEVPLKPMHGLDDDVVNMWLQKLPTPCAKNVFSFLTKHKGIKFTKSQLGLQTGYSTSSGSFNSTLSLLKRNNLIKTDGESWWFE
jgi:hypothetical protein